MIRTFTILALVFVFSEPLKLPAQTAEPVDFTGIDGAPGRWPTPGTIFTCCAGAWPKTGVFNTADSAPHDHPIFGYPMRGALFVGLNDTFQVAISLKNRTATDYPVALYSPQNWFVPRVYRPGVQANDASLWRDSTDLEYRMRGWWKWGVHWWRKTGAPSKILASADGEIAIAMDIWGLPEGVWCLCMDTTASIPADFIGLPFGYNYEYREALNLADSTNAYEGCFWRMVRDSNYAAALDWTSEILSINPNSVPGWWLRAYYYAICATDTQFAIEAYDKALVALNDGLDPAMPDSTERTLFEAEYDYVLWCKQYMEFCRSLLGP